jgi:phage host-nuclease inhibitor protein Gam
MDESQVAYALGDLTRAIEDQGREIHDLKTALKDSGKDCLSCRGQIDASIREIKQAVEGIGEVCVHEKGIQIGKAKMAALIGGAVVAGVGILYSVVMVAMAIIKIIAGQGG